MTTLRTGQTTDFGSQNLTASTASDTYTISSMDLDSVQIAETSWTPLWSVWHGMYRQIPELREVINKLASWTFGRGIEADKKNKAKLNKIKGNGKESPRLVLKNLWRAALICGDSFGHVLKDKQGRINNLKPLHPGTMKVIFNEFGIIIRYEQWLNNQRVSEFDPSEIFHLSYERIGDEIHGIPFPEALEGLIKARNQSMEDLDVLYHRNIKPINWIEVETDDTTKLDSLESTINKAYRKTENIIIPTGVIKEVKQSKTPQYSTLDSLPYIKFLVRQFVTACGMPEVIMGWGAETTEASSKIIYLSFQQEIEDMQLYIQEMVENQLGIEINLKFPASIETSLQRDQKKDSGQLKETNTNPTKDG